MPPQPPPLPLSPPLPPHASAPFPYEVSEGPGDLLPERSFCRLWQCASSDGFSLPGGAHVWAAWIDVSEQCADNVWPTLSIIERERAARFFSERDRTRFIVARGLLRLILSQRLGVEPHELSFQHGPANKPALAGHFARSGLHFSMARSDGIAVFALADHTEVGVDVEHIHSLPDLPALIRGVLSAREAGFVKWHSGRDQTLAFFKIWTRKEACLKTTGEGIANMLKLVDVSGPPGKKISPRPPEDGPGRAGISAGQRAVPGGAGIPAGQRAVPGGAGIPACKPAAPVRLRYYDLVPAPGFVGALALASG